VDGIDEHDRVDGAVQWPVAPVGHLRDHLVGYRGDRVARNPSAIDLGEVRRNLPKVMEPMLPPTGASTSRTEYQGWV
jgi:hypothetical protein